MKKIICFALLLLVLTVSVCAADIGTAEELVTLMNTESMWSGDYVLTKPINLVQFLIQYGKINKKEKEIGYGEKKK